MPANKFSLLAALAVIITPSPTERIIAPVSPAATDIFLLIVNFTRVVIVCNIVGSTDPDIGMEPNILCNIAAAPTSPLDIASSATFVR